jgi:hypothetical protein
MILLGLVIGNFLGLVLGAAYCVFVLTPLFPLTLSAAVNSFILAPGPAASILGPLLPLFNFISSLVNPLAALILGPPIVALIIILIVHFVVTVLLYLLVRAGMHTAISGVTTGPVPGNARQAFGRGWLIGMCAGVNLVILIWIAGLMLPPAVIAGPAWAVLIIVLYPIFAWILNNLAASVLFSRSPIYQGFLGWFAWLMPMAWPETLLGLFYMFANRILAAAGVGTVVVPGIGTLNPALGPKRFDWRTGTIVNLGGFFPPAPDGANNGNIVFVNVGLTDFPNSPGGRTISAVVWHETGHTLDVGAMGWLFANVTLIETTFFPSGPGGAYGERTAESHLRITRPFVPIWGIAVDTPPVATASAPPSAAAGTPLVLTGTFTDAESTVGTFFWRITTIAAGSALTTAFSTSPLAPNVTFTPDVAGTYIFALVVNDGRQNSPDASVTVNAV